jgi:hypothetical protein
MKENAWDMILKVALSTKVLEMRTEKKYLTSMNISNRNTKKRRTMKGRSKKIRRRRIKKRGRMREKR